MNRFRDITRSGTTKIRARGGNRCKKTHADTALDTEVMDVKALTMEMSQLYKEKEGAGVKAVKMEKRDP